MTRYNELASLAAGYSRRFHEQQRQCMAAADRLITGYAEYLGCPLDQIEQVRLEGGLRRTNEFAPLEVRLPSIVDGEGFWHFCWKINFDTGHDRFAAHEFVMVGLRINESTLTIREDRDFTANVNEPSTFDSVYDYLFCESKAGFSKQYGQQSGRIGFVLGDHRAA